MDSLFRIWSVALYEGKALLRSVYFKIFIFFALLIFILSIVYYLSPEWWHWKYRAVPSAIPYRILMLLNIIQAAIAVFMATESMENDRKLDIAKILYPRSISNLEYVSGKAIGAYVPFLLLNIILFCILYLLNAAVMDVSAAWKCYIYYPLLILAPTLIFVFGMSFLLMTVIRNKAITVTLLLAYIMYYVTTLHDKLYYLGDSLAYNLPLLYSDFIGFGNTPTLLMHRGMYFLFGLGCIILSAIFIKRLPQSKGLKKLAPILAMACFAVGIALGILYINGFKAGEKLRSEMRALNQKTAKLPRLTVTHYSINLVHPRNKINVNAGILCRNENTAPIETGIFSLNPGLSVEKVLLGGKEIPFKRTLHLIQFRLATPLAAGETDSLTICYQGIINEEACYADIDEKERKIPHRIDFFVIDKRYAFLTSNYVLLTPEALWYPVSSVPRTQVFPQAQGKDFASVELRVETNKKLTAISQGKSASNEPGRFLFKPEVPLPQISLVIGKYESKSVTVDSTEYSVFVRPGHDYFSKFLAKAQKQLPDQIRSIRWKLEGELPNRYPFPRFSIVEVPVQFFAYDRYWTIKREIIQPEQVLVAEKGFFLRDNPKPGKYESVWYKDKTEEEIQSIHLKNFLHDFEYPDEQSHIRGNRERRETPGISKEKIGSILYPENGYKYNLMPEFFCFIRSFHSEDYPLFGVAFEYYLKYTGSDHFLYPSTISDMEIAAEELSKQTLGAILSGPVPLDIKYVVLSNKSQELFNNLQYNIEKKDFDSFLREYLDNHRFVDIDVNDFLKSYKARFGIDPQPILERWGNEEKLPSFIFSNFRYTHVPDLERPVYQIRFTVYNPESVAGKIKASIFTDSERIERIIDPPGNTVKEIGITLEEPCQNGVQFDTFISRNKPSVFTIRNSEPLIDHNAELFDGERVVNQSQEKPEPGTIIVDTEDAGCTLVSTARKTILEKILKKNNEKV
jgi:hypothetical protein